MSLWKVFAQSVMNNIIPAWRGFTAVYFGIGFQMANNPLKQRSQHSFTHFFYKQAAHWELTALLMVK